MKFKTLTGSYKSVKNLKKYLIDWDKPSRSKIQFKVKEFIKPYWEKQIVFEEFIIVGTRMTLDFYNANKKIAIEVQGQQHTKYVPFFHGKYQNNYLEQLHRDHKKYEFCKVNEIKLVEVYHDDDLSVELFKKFGVSLY